MPAKGGMTKKQIIVYVIVVIIIFGLFWFGGNTAEERVDKLNPSNSSVTNKK